MGLLDQYKYCIRQIDPDLLAHIKQRIEEGRDLLASANKDQISARHFAWVNSFSSIIDILDPEGDHGTRTGTLSSRWYEAGWYNHDSAKSPYEDSIVFGQRLAVAQSLLIGKVKVVDQKLNKRDSRCVFHTRSLPIQLNSVFVLMPFTESWSDYIWKDEIKTVVESIPGHALVCKRADDLFGHDVMRDIYESIVSARVVIAEITGRNANVFYELGMAHTLGKEVILLTQNSEHIPFDLNRFRHCIYSNDGPGYRKLRSYLNEALIAILSEGASSKQKGA